MNAFNEISLNDFEQGRNRDIVDEIQLKGKEYILKIDEEGFINYLIEKFRLEPLSIDIKSEYVGKPSISRESIKNEVSSRGSYETNVYTFIVTYNFTGSPQLFRVQPNPWTWTSYDIHVNGQHNTVSFSFKLYKQDPEEFHRLKNQCYRDAFCNMEKLNENVVVLNNNLRPNVSNAFVREKEKHLKENDFFAAINIKVNPDTESVFTAPTVKRKIIPQPTVPKGKEFSSEPMMGTEMFKDVLRVIYDSGKNMEKKPALYENKDEEGLRDQFLFVLETRYEGTTATGETFNRSGKTDILLKYAKDASNLFVAECKFWHGASEFIAAITQLFDRYLTWRDSKAALLMFVKNKDFSSVLSTIKTEIKFHPCFKSEHGMNGESSFSYIFSLPQDKDKIVYFEVMAFHYDK